MAGTYAVEYSTGGTNGSPSWTALPGGGGTSFRFHTSTSVSEDLTNPIPIPDAGFNYSFWVSITLHIAGTYTQINNIRHYSDGTIGWNLGTGGQLSCGNDDDGSGGKGISDANYRVPTGTQGTSGDEVVANHPTVDIAQNIESFTAGSPLTVDTTNYGPNQDVRTKHIVLQPKVDTLANGALQGVTGSESLTWIADEI